MTRERPRAEGQQGQSTEIPRLQEFLGDVVQIQETCTVPDGDEEDQCLSPLCVRPVRTLTQASLGGGDLASSLGPCGT